MQYFSYIECVSTCTYDLVHAVVCTYLHLTFSLFEHEEMNCVNHNKLNSNNTQLTVIILDIGILNLLSLQNKYVTYSKIFLIILYVVMKLPI